MNIENFIGLKVADTVQNLYGQIDAKNIQLQKTRKEFQGDYTLVTFPLLKMSHKSPEMTAEEIGSRLTTDFPELIAGYNVVKGFLNISLNQGVWIDVLNKIVNTEEFGRGAATGKTVMIEYSSPNTNKPLHLGHIRNNLLGWSVSQLMEFAGNKVIRVNLVNDRGIHICKSMLAWQRFGNGETPESSGMKGDHLVGKYYVEFDKAYKAEIKELVAGGMTEDDAKKNAPIMLAAQEMLRKWEANDPEVYNLWKTMNGWVYEGFDATYKAMGVGFDKVYYESQTYLLGKEIVAEGLNAGVFYRRDDNSVWIDLTADGLDEKLLLRSDGTSVYMTQDLGTAKSRFDEFKLNQHIYVVGNEQNYHFQVLKLVLKKLGYQWSDDIQHLSYGMVELPEGKMKSREGTVVDADDLINGMVSEAHQMSKELGKLDGCSEQEAMEVSKMVGLGALKYFILKVDPKKTMLFDPKESIDFNGNTGPFIQYTHARIKSLLRRAEVDNVEVCGALDMNINLTDKEVALISHIADFPAVAAEAANQFSPALVANYIYDLVKEYNQFYHDYSILKEENQSIKKMRLVLSAQVARVVKSGMELLGIGVPERM